MNQVKYIIGTVLLSVLVNQTAYAQSTALNPYEGATHTYSWNGLQEGVDYQFYFTADANGSVVLDDIATGEFDFIGNPKGQVGAGESSASVPILWNRGASEHIYYLWFEVTAPGGCSNNIYLRIAPQVNAFDLLSENIPADNTVSCPAIASTDGFNVMASAYDAGSTTLQFKVRRVNGTDNKLTAQAGDTYNWAFEPVLTIDPNWNLDISIVSVVGVTSGSMTADANKIYTVSGTDNEVTVTVSIKNLPGTSQDVSLKIQNQSEIHTNLSDSNAANDIVKHRIEIMPVIGGMNGV